MKLKLYSHDYFHTSNGLDEHMQCERCNHKRLITHLSSTSFFKIHKLGFMALRCTALHQMMDGWG